MEFKLIGKNKVFEDNFHGYLAMMKPKNLKDVFGEPVDCNYSIGKYFFKTTDFEIYLALSTSLNFTDLHIGKYISSDYDDWRFYTVYTLETKDSEVNLFLEWLMKKGIEIKLVSRENYLPPLEALIKREDEIRRTYSIIGGLLKTLGREKPITFTIVQKEYLKNILRAKLQTVQEQMDILTCQKY